MIVRIKVADLGNLTFLLQSVMDRIRKVDIFVFKQFKHFSQLQYGIEQAHSGAFFLDG